MLDIDREGGRLGSVRESARQFDDDPIWRVGSG